MPSSIDHPDFWNEKYINNQTGWDLKSANPVFVEIINNKALLQPGKILVLGSGKGYDAVEAAKAGFVVTAVDFSSQAINFSKELAVKENVKIEFLEDDIFFLDKKYNESFDIVYEYTTYCAINPERRKEYAEKVPQLIKPGGKLIAILFPVEEREGGPPFGVDEIEFYKLFSKELKLELSSKKINSVKPRIGREILQIYLKPGK